jgi:hypothetical protein
VTADNAEKTFQKTLRSLLRRRMTTTKCVRQVRKSGRLMMRKVMARHVVMGDEKKGLRIRATAIKVNDDTEVGGGRQEEENEVEKVRGRMN